MNQLGTISISADVVVTIAETVISEISGVYGLAGSNSKNEIIKFFQNVSSGGSGKGIEVEIGETECSINLYIVAKYGEQLTSLAGKIQTSIVEEITKMTGLKVTEVNVFIQKVYKEEKENETVEEVKAISNNAKSSDVIEG